MARAGAAHRSCVAGLAARRAAPPTPRHPRARGSSAGGTATRRSIPRTHLGIWRDAGAGAPRLLDTRTAAAATKDDDGPAEPGNGRSDRRAAGLTDGAICVQRLDDSLNSAIHTRYRSSRRSSSMHEPRGPPLKVVLCFSVLARLRPSHESVPTLWRTERSSRERGAGKDRLDRGGGPLFDGLRSPRAASPVRPPPAAGNRARCGRAADGHGARVALPLARRERRFGNDPSAGSPTETLLRLLLPLNDQV